MELATRIASTHLCSGAVLVLEFGPAPANIIDRELMKALGLVLEEAAADAQLKLVVLKGVGKHFSYGASVPEHTPEQVGAMLPEFHAFLRKLHSLPLPPLMAAVQGRCLGGGFEVALACDLIAVTADAQLGCPEIHLGVFPPAGSALLPLRLSAAQASAMLLAGSTVSGEEALRLGLAEVSAEGMDFFADIQSWAEKNVLKHSAAALRQGRRASRWPWSRALEEILPQLEKQYLEQLMATEDAVEGIQAFLDKRKPHWSNR